METMKVEVESNSEGREDVELIWDDWGHERDARDNTGDGWDHVEDVVVVGESTKSDKLTEADSWTDEALPVGWRNPIFKVESYRFTEADSWKDKCFLYNDLIHKPTASIKICLNFKLHIIY